MPVLLEHLRRLDEPGAIEIVARLLTDPRARPRAALPLIEKFMSTPSRPEHFQAKWALGNALNEVADDSVFDRLAVAIADTSHGRGREMLLPALGRTQDPRRLEVAIQALRDPELTGHALSALAEIATSEERALIARFVEHEEAWIRAEAKKALRRIDGSKRS